ncbi:NAD-dependent succinate-semialdehyde dehydrogenase [Phycicoccus endophyticus]|uniref:NAD-dependent succinate-semialdehyde dehydrogenase n=1 Tax=Phycicoccus endophyticus TaxID=1690220 RepID=A0A7G9QY56_9MICO|nr:NAD-dependent succinate-semialdehyde dehydrogenase [Phycicoccus endophyticus]NHI19165.1 NAD-dependent succinate-semialdehyde dehydrogenase [Phycicoccus endophyticus]QNN48281.1 NAD-dependent succinate-semialdehyde dehydrogenase [Phycicoccus endophyticus]GGL40692.1 NAD-dependent succinate-semialdehyde dehydrogenase [Phycicoccus endophyticus]
MATTQKDLLASVPTRLLVGGRWREASGGARFEVHDPSSGATLATCADATPEDGLAALAAAAGAQASWAATPPRERGEILRRAFELVTARAEELALLMTLEMGKTLPEARGEVTYGAEFLRWFSEEAVRVHGRYAVAPNGATRLVTMAQPVGPTLMITPWNFPLAMGTRKIAPAVAAGCTMVVKPAAETPLTMLLLADILIEAGLPEGVLNVVTTTDSGGVCEPVIRDPRLRKLTFTGSTAVGRRLVEQSAQQLLRLSMELGGNAPFLVFEDADLDAAVEGAMLAKMRNIGEACTAANRFFVHEDVAAEFSRRLAERMGALTVGKGTKKGVDVGPLITEKARAGVHDLVEDAVGRGARVLTGGAPVPGRGHFYAPTVLADVPEGSRCLTEEIFGPVAPVCTFRDEAEAVERANATEYGLVGYLFTRDNARVLRVAEALEFGMVGVNTGIVSNPAAPFGGVKQSGFGREGGFEGIEEYLEVKYVGIAT